MTPWEHRSAVCRRLPFNELEDDTVFRLERYVGFLGGFLIEMNILVGGNGGAAETGGYGFRITDFFSLVCVLLLTTRIYNAQRIVSVTLYCIAVAVMFLPQCLSSNDRTAILALHYVLYCFSGLYLCLLISEGPLPFCTGLIVGLMCTILVFVLQDLNLPQEELSRWGLAPGYRPDLTEIARVMPRYSGLWSHPNEVGHVAALGGPAGAYWFLARRKVLPVAIVVACLLASFLFCWSRGGLVAGSSAIAVALLWPKGGKLNAGQLIGMIGLALAALLLWQLDFVSSRFSADPNFEGNIAERLNTMLQGLQLVLSNPIGLPIDDYVSELNALTGGVNSPHNGFLFFGAVFGIVPVVVLVYAMVANLWFREPSDLFFSLLAIQVLVTFQFEQVPGSYGYILVICILLARAFVKSEFGRFMQRASGRPLAPTRKRLHATDEEKAIRV